MYITVNLFQDLLNDPTILSHDHARSIIRDIHRVKEWMDKRYNKCLWMTKMDPVRWELFIAEVGSHPYEACAVEVPDIEDNPTLWITGANACRNTKE